MRDGNGAISLIYRAERYNTLLPYLLRLACIPYLAYILLPCLPTLHPPRLLPPPQELNLQGCCSINLLSPLTLCSTLTYLNIRWAVRGMRAWA